MPKKKRSWGGRREGSGRKQVVGDPVRLAIDVERRDLDALKAQAKRQDISMAEYIRQVLARAARRKK